MSQTSAKTKVMRLRLRSAADEPRAAPPPPPNMSDRPPPRPLCMRMPATMAINDRTLRTRTRYMTTSRTASQPTERSSDCGSLGGRRFLGRLLQQEVPLDAAHPLLVGVGHRHGGE